MPITKERKLYQVKIINGGENHTGKYLYDFLDSYYEDGKLIKQEITQGDIDEVDKLSIDKFLKDINSNQLKKMSDIEKEKIRLQDIATKESSDKMILQTELLNAKEALKAHEENFNIAKSINDEIYAENKKLKEANEKILKDMVKLDENIISLNAQIVALKKGK